MSASRSHTCDATGLYWRDIEKSRPLSRQREVELFRRARQGDEQARQQLVLANLRFVVKLARNFSHHGLSLIELVSAGNFGLMEAIHRFDETRGFKFITYAAWWIRQAIFTALGEHGRAFRSPMSQVNDLIKTDRESNHLSHTLGRQPSPEEIAHWTGISLQRIETARQAAQATLSLDAPADGDDEAPLLAFLPAMQEGTESKLEKDELSRSLQACLEVLDPRELRIVRAYFGLDGARRLTLEEIGDRLGITRERVRQLSKRALDKLRRHGGEQLAEFCRN